MKLTIGAITLALALSVAPAARPQRPSPPVVVKVEAGGFHWVDALIGAGALAGVALCVSGAITVFPRRHHEAAPTTPKEER